MKKSLFFILVIILVTLGVPNAEQVTVYAEANEDEVYEEEMGRDIDVTDFASLQKAVNEAQEDDIISLTRNISTSKKIVLKNDVKVTINFNNFLYNYTGSQEAFVIKSGIIVFSNANIRSKNYAIAVEKNGSITIESGKCSGYIKNNGFLEIIDGIFNNSGAKKSKADELIQNYGILTIGGGKFTNTVDNCIYSKKGEVYITGGSFVGQAAFDSEHQLPTLLNLKNSSLEIDGNIYVSGKANAIDNSGSLVISGGKYYSSNFAAVVNKGSMKIESANITIKNKNKPAIYNEGKVSIDDAKSNGCIYNYAGNITLADVRLKCSSDCLVNDGKGTIKISDGYYYTTKYAGLTNVSGTVTMTGGLMKSKRNTVVNYKGASFKMTGGNVVGTTGCAAIYNLGNIYLYGGDVKSSGKHYYVINESGSTCKVKRSKIGYYNSIEWK